MKFDFNKIQFVDTPLGELYAIVTSENTMTVFSRSSEFGDKDVTLNGIEYEISLYLQDNGHVQNYSKRNHGDWTKDQDMTRNAASKVYELMQPWMKQYLADNPELRAAAEIRSAKSSIRYAQAEIDRQQKTIDDLQKHIDECSKVLSKG